MPSAPSPPAPLIPPATSRLRREPPPAPSPSVPPAPASLSASARKRVDVQFAGHVCRLRARAVHRADDVRVHEPFAGVHAERGERRPAGGRRGGAGGLGVALRQRAHGGRGRGEVRAGELDVQLPGGRGGARRQSVPRAGQRELQARSVGSRAAPEAFKRALQAAAGQARRPWASRADARRRQGEGQVDSPAFDRLVRGERGVHQRRGAGRAGARHMPTRPPAQQRARPASATRAAARNYRSGEMCSGGVLSRKRRQAATAAAATARSSVASAPCAQAAPRARPAGRARLGRGHVRAGPRRQDLEPSERGRQRARASQRPVTARPSARALQALLRSGTISEAVYSQDYATYVAAKRSLAKLSGTRARRTRRGARRTYRRWRPPASSSPRACPRCSSRSNATAVVDDRTAARQRTSGSASPKASWCGSTTPARASRSSGSAPSARPTATTCPAMKTPICASSRAKRSRWPPSAPAESPGSTCSTSTAARRRGRAACRRAPPCRCSRAPGRASRNRPT